MLDHQAHTASQSVAPPTCVRSSYPAFSEEATTSLLEALLQAAPLDTFSNLHVDLSPPPATNAVSGLAQQVPLDVALAAAAARGRQRVVLTWLQLAIMVLIST